MGLIYGAFASLIVTTIVTESYLFGPVRNLMHRANRHLGVLFSCFLCFGAWVGIMLGFFIETTYNPVIAGLAFHGTAFALHTVIGLIDDLRIRLQR